MYTGPNIVKDGIIFYYDTGNSKSYKGEPTTNLILFNVTVANFSNDYGSNLVSQTANYSITYKGRPSLKIVSTAQWNLYRAGRAGNFAETSSAVFTFSWKMKWSDGKVPVFGGYIYTDGYYYYPSVTVSAIDDGWYLCQTSATGTSAPLWLTGFNSTQTGTCYVTDWQAEAKSHASEFITSNTTRSVTQGLLPLTTKTTLDLSNVSFDSNGTIIFDGTNDYFDINQNFGILSQYTIEYVAYSNGGTKMPISSRTTTNFYKYGDASWYYTHGGVGGEFYHGTSPAISGDIHYVIRYDGSNVKVWRNNNYAGAQASTGTADFSDGFKVGWWTGGGSYAWNGKIPIIKIYNKALTTDEVSIYYNAIKTRFNI